jgi:RimJ/RimL family protein N-acetyltransferase
MKDLVVTQLTPADASALSALLTADDRNYRQYCIPLATDTIGLEERLSSAREDRYWGLWFGGVLTGFFMMRGFDDEFRKPSFGVYIAARAYSGKGLSTPALEYSMSWCRMTGFLP